MVIRGVKQKVPFFGISSGLAGVTFLASWTQIFPKDLVETWYSRGVFPRISHLSSIMADAIPFSWLDLWIPFAVALLIYSAWRRRWRLLLGAIFAFYLWFFWGWGLNYHRPPLASRLHLDLSALSESDFERFTETAVEEINRLWPQASSSPLDRETIGRIASGRVERVIREIDQTSWKAAAHVKHSVLADPWYRVAGVDGMFNPFGQEPLVVAGPYPFELPFLMSHEIAHVRGVANEGEANLIALLSTVASDDPRFQYSGWLYLWEYLGKAPHTKLDPGPMADLTAIEERIRSGEIAFLSDVQS